MTQSRSAFRNRLEWLLVCAWIGPVVLLPRRGALAVMRRYGDLAYLLLRSRREHTCRLVEDRLGAAPRRARAIVRGAFQTMALNLVENHLLQRELKSRALEDLVTIEGLQHAQELQRQGRGLLLATAHLGAWESMAEVLRRCLSPVWAVARPLDNPLLERLVVRYRLNALAGTLEKDGSGLPMARLLRKGEIVALLLDQNAGRKSVTIDFLGAPSRQHKVSGAMAARLGVPILPAYLLREPDGLHYRFVVEPPIEADPLLGDEAAEEDVVRRVSASLEARVRAHPEQWLWLHDRWRSARHTAIVEQLVKAARRPRGQAGDPSDELPEDGEAGAAAKRETVAVPEGTNEG